MESISCEMNLVFSLMPLLQSLTSLMLTAFSCTVMPGESFFATGKSLILFLGIIPAGRILRTPSASAWFIFCVINSSTAGATPSYGSFMNFPVVVPSILPWTTYSSPGTQPIVLEKTSLYLNSTRLMFLRNKTSSSLDKSRTSPSPSMTTSSIVLQFLFFSWIASSSRFSCLGPDGSVLLVGFISKTMELISSLGSSADLTDSSSASLLLKNFLYELLRTKNGSKTSEIVPVCFHMSFKNSFPIFSSKPSPLKLLNSTSLANQSLMPNRMVDSSLPLCTAALFIESFNLPKFRDTETLKLQRSSLIPAAPAPATLSSCCTSTALQSES
ncbi:unnamed protein product [Oikopleura dioica]|uniref:Uncharacterized protein n=1 Tax=Oikopleura dioica TaxID=34765 RepID=E4X295_OIKDI|nr:unnamed protein product [Oikopleura dioica]